MAFDNTDANRTPGSNDIDQPDLQPQTTAPVVQVPRLHELAVPDLFFDLVRRTTVPAPHLRRCDPQRETEKLRGLQERIADDERKMQAHYDKPTHTVNEQDHNAIIHVLHKYRQQWRCVRDILNALQLSLIGSPEMRPYAQLYVISKSYLNYLEQTFLALNHSGPAQCENELEDALFSSLKIHPGRGFRLSKATNVDVREKHDEKKWKEAIEMRYGTYVGANQAAKDLYGEPSGIALTSLDHILDDGTFSEHPTSKLNTQPPDSGQKTQKSRKKRNTAASATEQGNARFSEPRAEKPHQNPKLAYCPVLKDFIPRDKGCAAYIVAHAWGYKLAKAIFKDGTEGKDILWHVRNGLWMCKKVEEAFDNGQVILLPVNTEMPKDHEVEDYEVKLVVLDPSLLGNKNMIWSWVQPDGKEKQYLWNDVNEKPLDFREAKERPARGYLYFNYLHTITQYTTQRPKKWKYGLKKLNQVGKNWSTPGSYLT